MPSVGARLPARGSRRFRTQCAVRRAPGKRRRRVCVYLFLAGSVSKRVSVPVHVFIFFSHTSFSPFPSAFLRSELPPPSSGVCSGVRGVCFLPDWVRSRIASRLHARESLKRQKKKKKETYSFRLLFSPARFRRSFELFWGWNRHRAAVPPGSY